MSLPEMMLKLWVIHGTDCILYKIDGFLIHLDVIFQVGSIKVTNTCWGWLRKPVAPAVVM